MEDGEVEHLSLLSLFCLSPEGSNLWIMETFSPSPCLCYHDLYDVAGDVGCHSLCSTCCTSPRTPSPTVDNFLFPSAHGHQDLDPLVQMAPGPGEVVFFHQDCDSGSHQEIETVT